MEPIWNAVDEYFNQRLRLGDDALSAALADSTAAGLPAINVTPAQGKLLMLLARMCQARRILEVGTLGGYSAIWMGRALPDDGALITLEINPANAAVAQRNLERAGLAGRVEVILAPATESLNRLIADRVQPFDLVFIDADKERSVEYFDAALALSHPGTVIIVDNVVREGAIIDARSTDANVQGMRRLTEHVARERRVSVTAIQTVGSKGYDGFILAVVTT
ncbi:MAG TPA: O-methyltransferase [Gemmatimonadaceae bacterium]